MALPLVVSAQLGAGQWKIHSYFVGANPKNCVDAGNKVYYLNSGSLYCFDKEAQTNGAIDANTVLNDINISQIYYNYDKQYLVVAYSNCNIDIILSSGKVVNVPAIKEVTMHELKTINNVTFGGDKMFVATSFGYLALDAETFAVQEVRNFNTNVASVAKVGNTRMLSLGGKFYYCDSNSPVESLADYKSAANAKGDGAIYPINETKFFLTCKSTFQIVTVAHHTDVQGEDSCSFTFTQVVGAAPVTVQPYPQGYVASFPAKNYYYTILPDASKTTKVTGNEIYTSQEDGNWWVLGANGLAHIEGGVKDDYVSPNGVSISANPFWMTYDPYQQRVILCRTTDIFVLPTANSGAKTEINAYDGTNWTNITPANAPNLGGNTNIVVSPNEPNTYFYGTRTTGGVCKVKNDTVVTIYNTTNSPIVYRASLQFDSKGNLWIPQAHSPLVMAITPENQLKTEVDPSMFVTHQLDGSSYNGAGFKRQSFCIGAGDIKAYASGEWNYPIWFWNNNDDLSLNQYIARSSFNDQEGKEFSAWGYIFLKADNDSMIWVGTTGGVIAINPLEVFNDDFKVKRIVYNKFEGSYAVGVLCEGLQVNYIDVDANNNKWIATNASGVYFVSPDGSEIYKHFDSTNSALPSDQVYSVCCNRATNSVLIVTPNGVVEYFNDVTPAAADYSDVYAYPNPVEPGYTGLITINGLMANSNVVITDADGNVVKTLVSNGAIALWDGYNNNGQHVPTGYYKVFASQGEPDITGEPLTKIAVIK